MRMVATAILASLALGGKLGAQDTDIFPFEYRRVDLENGFRAYLVDAGAPGQIAYVSIVRTGARDEVDVGKSGFAHFFEHLMFAGTAKYPDYNGIASSMGAVHNAQTSNDGTLYFLVAANDYLEQIVDLESDRFMNLSYAEGDFRTRAGAVLGEYQNSAGSNSSVLNRAVRETAYRAHPYRHSVLGFEDDIRAMPEGYAYSKEFYQRHYRPENVILVLTGNFDFDEAEGLIHQYYDHWEPGYVEPDIPVEPEQSEARVEMVEYRGQTLPMLSVSHKGPAWSPTDRVAAATEILGSVAFGQNSDLYRKLVLEEQRVDFLRSRFGLQRDPALLTVTAMVNDPEDVQAVGDEILATVERFKEELVDGAQLEATKSNMKYGFLMDLETAQNVSFALIQTVVNTGGIEAINDYYHTLDSITAEDIREAARTYLVEAGRTTVTLVQARPGE